MELQNIQNLLVQASAINRQYEKIANLTGENFNVFKILGLSTNEVRTHSAFIGELLNPKGSHGQSEIFLQLFCDQMGIKEFACQQATIEIEKYIGPISYDYSEGGYIDILISDKKGHAIVIENKIYAVDQKKQLTRYYNYAQKNIKEHTLFYLTLDGKQARKESKCGITDDYCIRNVSYTEHILEWLEKCREKAVNHPILRETITQYIYLIKHLTYQTLSNDMLNELISLIASNKDYYNIIKDLNHAYDKFNGDVINKFWKALQEKVRLNFPTIIIGDLELKYDSIEGSKACSFPVVVFQDLIVKCDISEDDEAFYYGFFIERLADTSPDLSDLKKYADSLRAVNPYFTMNPNYNIGWISINGTKDTHLFKGNVDKDLIFSLNRGEELDKFIGELIRELHGYAEQFKGKLQLMI